MKETRENLRSVWKYFAPYKRSLIIFSGLTFLITIVGAITPFLTAKIVTSITNNVIKEVLLIGMFYLVLNFVIGILKYFNNKNYYLFQGKAVKNIRIDYCKNILKVDTKTFDEKGSGLFLSRFSTDLVTFSYIFSQLVNNVSSIIINVGVYVLVFFINFYVGLFFVIGSILLFSINKIRIDKKNKIWREYKKIDEKNQSVFSEMLRGIRDLKVLNLQKGMLRYVLVNLDENRKHSYDMDMINSRYDFLIELVQNLLRFLFLFICSAMVINARLNVANFLVLFMYQDKIFSAIYAIAHLRTELNLFNLCSKNILEIMASNGIKKETYGNVELKKIRGNLEFKNVNFSYEPNVPVLRNVNIKIEANQKVGIVGESGAGKSTIINLVSKLYDVTCGSVLIDGHNVNNLSEKTIKTNVSVITQDPYVFNLTIKENLLLAAEGLTDKDVIEKCKQVHLHDFIITLPDGYNTVIGENGVNLSGGQKQRLAIARALLRKSKIIIFDEATNALDNETQRAVDESLNVLRGKCTIIIIAHRLSSIVDCDNVYLIKNGVVVASGRHDELLKNNVYYKKLYKE
ncbi:MAG: ABC transporter ATP-binding protein [Bacilli bacterium]|nr:ABC transporter ATP-binding protein [Bacilli bacterium]